MKILFLSKYYNQVDRGAETYVKELSKRLQKNHQVDIFSGKDSENVQKIVDGKYDIVIPTNGRMQALKAGMGRIVGKYKLIISGQAGMGKDDYWNILACRPNSYVALTDFEANWAKKFAWGVQIVKIPNGVDLEKFSPMKNKIDLSLKPPVVLSVAALEWYKHHELTIRAVSKLNDVSLLIIGAGFEKDKLQLLGDGMLKDHFRIIQTKFEEIPKYYRSADLFCLPSWDREAFGIVYLEALASGLPVVAPDDSPRREIVGDSGIFVDVANPKEYSEAIEKALKLNWGDKPRQQAEKFSWDKVAEKYEGLFKELTK